MSRPPLRYRLREAWPGLERPENRGNPVHFVDWPLGQRTGAALCSERLVAVLVTSVGTADVAGVRVCGRCLGEAPQNWRRLG